MKERSIGDKRVRKLHPPKIVSREEEVKWWEEHREYWDQLDTPFKVVEGMGPVRAFWVAEIRLPMELRDAVKAEAERRGVPWHDLVEQWIEAGLARTEKNEQKAGERR